MCKHCERLVEDAAHKQVVHDFMAVLTAGINRKLSEDGKRFQVTVDEVEFYATLPNKDALLIPPRIPDSVLRLMYNDLLEAVK